MSLVVKIAAGVFLGLFVFWLTAFLLSLVLINGSLVAVVLLLLGLAILAAAAIGLLRQRKSPLSRAS